MPTIIAYSLIDKYIQKQACEHALKTMHWKYENIKVPAEQATT
jgi:hypothetical protein